MRVGSTRLRGVSSGAVPPHPSSTSADTAEASGADADVPPPITSNDSDIQRTLDHVLTIQVAHG